MRSGRGSSEQGSSTVDFVLVGTLLTALTLAILQFGFAVYVRNIVHDAASEGAHYAALADRDPLDGIERTALVITRAIGPQYAEDISAGEAEALGHPTVVIQVRTTLPLIGLIGIAGGLQLSAQAPREMLDD